MVAWIIFIFCTARLVERWRNEEQWEFSYHGKPPGNDSKDVLKDVFKRRGETNNFKIILKGIIKSNESNIHYWKRHLESKNDKKKTIFQKRLAKRESIKGSKTTKGQNETADEVHARADVDNNQYWRKHNERRESREHAVDTEV